MRRQLAELALPLANACALGNQILIEMTHTTVGTVMHTGIVIAHRHVTKLSVPVLCAIAHGDAFDDVTGAGILAYQTSTGIPRWQLTGITETRWIRGLAQIRFTAFAYVARRAGAGQTTSAICASAAIVAVILTRVRLAVFAKEAEGAVARPLTFGANAAGATILAETCAFIELATFAGEAIGTLALRCSGECLSAYATILTGQVQTMLALIALVHFRTATLHALRFGDQTRAAIVATALAIRHRSLATCTRPVGRAGALQWWWFL